MDDLGLNKYLEDEYGRTPEGMPYFRLIWSTGVTEKRFSEFHDFYGDLFIRKAREVREVLKYPFAQDRWILERIALVTEQAIEMGLRVNTKYDYVEVYTFQDKDCNYLPLDREMLEVALYLFFKVIVNMSWKDRTDLRMQIEARKYLERKKRTKELMGEGRSPYFFVRE